MIHNINAMTMSCNSYVLILTYKVEGISEYIPKSFKDADTMILDSEILLMDSKTNLPLVYYSHLFFLIENYLSFV
jgi:hypothetical protein